MIMTWFDVERAGKATTTLRRGQRSAFAVVRAAMPADGVGHPHEVRDSGGKADFIFGHFFRLTVGFGVFIGGPSNQVPPGN
ncbi:MAG: hypothetical protein Q8N89_12330 [Azonexus sp.]|nr:hypothetical protein [Azonexus sp.]